MPSCISVVEKEDSDDDDEMEYDINVINISSLPHPSRDKMLNGDFKIFLLKIWVNLIICLILNDN